MKNFLRELEVALIHHNLSLKEWCEKAGVVYSTAHAVIRGRSPNDALFKAFCTSWPDSETGLNILHAWLIDETIRSGRSLAEIDFQRGHAQHMDHMRIEENLRAIQDALTSGDIDMAEMIADLANSVRRHKVVPLMVAEGPAQYMADDKKKRPAPPKKAEDDAG